MWWSKRDQPYTAILPRMIGNGGPGTIYTSTAFLEATEKHGKPYGPFDRDRIAIYDAAMVHLVKS